MTEFEIIKNGSGYYDPTAYEAIKKTDKKGKKKMENFYQGDIVKCKQQNGTEREYVILSVHDKFSTVLMLGNDEKMSFSIKSNGLKYAEPGMLQYMYNDNIICFIRSLTDKELNSLMNAVIDSLGYDFGLDSAAAETTLEPVVKEVFVENQQTVEELTKAKAERDVYKNLYENLINSMITK